jgi:hypothetical protein
MSIKSRLTRLERELYVDDSAPRQIIVWFGPHFEESWIEPGPSNGVLHFHVRVPDLGHCDPRDYLTPEMSAALRPTDYIVSFRLVDNGRNDHLEMHKPPWKRTNLTIKPDRLRPDLEPEPMPEGYHYEEAE